jgi:hypothetical protein
MTPAEARRYKARIARAAAAIGAEKLAAKRQSEGGPKPSRTAWLDLGGPEFGNAVVRAWRSRSQALLGEGCPNRLAGRP